MSDFEKFKNEVLFNCYPFTQDEIVNDIDKINEEAHKNELFTEQLKVFLTDIPLFSIEKSKMFAIKYIEEYHNWLLENYDIKPKT